MTKRQILASFTLVPFLGAGLLGVTSASAMCMGFGYNQNLTSEQIATNQTDKFQEQANLLGVSIDDVKNAWADGKNFMDLAKEKGITKESLQTKMQTLQSDRIKTELSTLVSKGVITQAQADKRLAAIQTKTTNKKGHGKHGFRGIMGAFGGF